MRLAVLSALVAFLTFPLSAHADPASMWYVLTEVVGYIVYVATTYTTAFVVAASMAYGNLQRRRQERDLKDAYNRGLQDRTITRVATEAPYRTVYGRARVGSDVVAIFSSGDKDQYKHLVCVHAAHECDAIEEIYVAGKALGPLDVFGWVTSGDYFKAENYHKIETKTGSSFALAHTPIDGLVHITRETTGAAEPAVITPESVNGTTVTLSQDYGQVKVAYSYAGGWARVNVQKHLGVPGDPADQYLMSILPEKWTSNHKLTGLCYTIVTLDLNQVEFQGGLPPIEVVVRGKKLYDFRTGTTSWSQNAVLAIYDYLTGDLCGVSPSVLPMSQWIAAANVCDEVVGVGSASYARYTINGAVTSDQPQAQVLEGMVQAMGGSLNPTSWDIRAGSYSAPTLALTAQDVVGKITVTPGLPASDLFNGVRGQYVSAETNWVVTDFDGYQNTSLVTSDGTELWTNIDFLFTDTQQRIHNLSRIFIEDQREGLSVKADFSMKAWSARIGQRVTLDYPLFGFASKVFRVVARKYTPAASAIELTLKEDGPSIWDFADTVSPNSIPNSGLTDPYQIDALGELTITSGDGDLLLMSDGTVVSRMKVAWPAASTLAIRRSGIIEIEWQENASDVWQRMQVSGNEVYAYVSPVKDKVLHAVRARAVNPYLGASSAWTYGFHVVAGKSAPPPDVTMFSLTNGALSWREISQSTTPDLAGYLIRFQYGMNASWGDATTLHSGVLKHSPWTPSLVPPGQITLMIKAVDTSGNASVNSANIEVNLGDPLVENLILTYDDKAAGFPGEKTNCSIVGGNLVADDSGDLFWGGDTSLFWGYDTANFWPTATYKAMTYVFSYTVDSVRAGSRMTLVQNIAGQSYTLQFRYDTQGTFWGAGSDFFWGSDGAAFWPTPTDWQTWPGAIDSVQVGKIDFRITTQAGTVQGAVSALQVQFDVPDESENLSGIAILATGSRLPISKAYRSIENVQLTLQADGGSAVTAKCSDKSAIGPLIYCYNSSGAAVTGTIDATVQGVKG